MDKNSCKNIVIVILLIVVLLVGYQLLIKKEHITGSETMTRLSNEALQNIAGVYADTDGTVTFNNVKITGNLDVGSNIVANQNITAGQLIVASNIQANKNLIAQTSNLQAISTNFIRNGGDYIGDTIEINNMHVGGNIVANETISASTIQANNNVLMKSLGFIGNNNITMDQDGIYRSGNKICCSFD